MFRIDNNNENWKAKKKNSFQRDKHSKGGLTMPDKCICIWIVGRHKKRQKFIFGEQ